MLTQIREYFEGRAIKSFLGEMSGALKKRYGTDAPYTYKQVQATIEDLGLKKEFSDFAFFVYCSKEEHEKYGFHFEEIKRYEGYRDRHLGGACGGNIDSGTSGQRGDSAGEGICGGDGD
jgi:hypothetical protein